MEWTFKRSVMLRLVTKCVWKLILVANVCSQSREGANVCNTTSLPVKCCSRIYSVCCHLSLIFVEQLLRFYNLERHSINMIDIDIKLGFKGESISTVLSYDGHTNQLH